MLAAVRCAAILVGDTQISLRIAVRAWNSRHGWHADEFHLRSTG